MDEQTETQSYHMLAQARTGLFVEVEASNSNEVLSKNPCLKIWEWSHILSARVLLRTKTICWGAWVAQSVKRLTSAQVMISSFVSSCPTSGSVLTARSLEPTSDSVSPSLSLCPSPAHAVSLSKINKREKNFKKRTKTIHKVPWIKKHVTLCPRPQMATTQRFITNRWLQYRSEAWVYLEHGRPAQQSRVISHLHSYQGIKFQLKNDYIFPQSFWWKKANKVRRVGRKPHQTMLFSFSL